MLKQREKWTTLRRWSLMCASIIGSEDACSSLAIISSYLQWSGGRAHVTDASCATVQASELVRRVLDTELRRGALLGKKWHSLTRWRRRSSVLLC